MAKQIGHILIEGTLGGLTYYKMDGIYYVRKKSTLSRNKVLKSPRFERTRQHASQLAEASKIASSIYKQLPQEKRNVELFRALVGQAKVMLASGKEKEAVFEILLNEIFPQPKTLAERQIIKKEIKARAYVNKEGKLIWEEFNSAKPILKRLMKTVNRRLIVEKVPKT